MYRNNTEYTIGTNLMISSNLESVALVLYRLARKKIQDQDNWTRKSIKKESLFTENKLK